MSAGQPLDPHPTIDASVVICAYTFDRWELLNESIQSVLDQHKPPRELIVCIDHNTELFDAVSRRWGTREGPVPITVLENKYSGRLGSARTTAAEAAEGSLIAFLDDDACAEPNWLEELVEPLSAPSVVAVGGAPEPRYEVPRPGWIPHEYDWVFGCRYRGLPEVPAPVRHVIGAAMAARRADLIEIGGFHSDNHDDMDMCHRLLAAHPGSTVLFVPSAIVHHFVPSHRLRWSYFWRRCFFVNRGKVGAFADMGPAANLSAELNFVRRTLLQGLVRELRDFLHGDRAAGARWLAICGGAALAGSGYLVGTIEHRLQRHLG